jgi:hypothetical protein
MRISHNYAVFDALAALVLQRLAPALLEVGIAAEYWEKKGVRAGATDKVEAFWIFLSTEKERPTSERVEELVWSRVAYFEGMGNTMDIFMDNV